LTKSTLDATSSIDMKTWISIIENAGGVILKDAK